MRQRDRGLPSSPVAPINGPKWPAASLGHSPAHASADSRMLRWAAEEIAQLRAENRRLGDHVNLTERLLALFDGGGGENCGAGIDLLHDLRDRAAALDAVARAESEARAKVAPE